MVVLPQPDGPSSTVKLASGMAMLDGLQRDTSPHCLPTWRSSILAVFGRQR